MGNPTAGAPVGPGAPGSPCSTWEVGTGTPADSGAMAVLATDSRDVEIAVYPIVQDGDTLGALVLRRKLDAHFLAAQSAKAVAGVGLPAGWPVRPRRGPSSRPGSSGRSSPHW